MKENNSICNEKEKKIIIYLIIVFLILIYFSLFFIHNIEYKGIIKDNETVFNPENTIDNNETIVDKENIVDNIENIFNSDNRVNNNKKPLNSNNTVNNNENVSNSNNIKDNNENVINPDNTVDNNDNIINPDDLEDSNENISNPDNVVNNKDRFKVFENTNEWSKLKELNIFENKYFNNQLIAPGVHGNYNFTIENNGDTKLEYNIDFIEENISKINMVYKLKLNGLYVVGNESKWVKYDKLNIEKFIIDSQTNDLFTIEWKWQDSENDTQIGENEDTNYKLKIKITATSIEE